MITADQHRAANRFGLGASRSDALVMGDDPVGWLIEQIDGKRKDSGPEVAERVGSLAQRIAMAMDRRQAQGRADGDTEKIARIEREQQSNRQQTVLIMVTEFGRTVAMNGTRGSDHGVAGRAFVMGGAVAGGRVITDWPGLKSSLLYEGRDLMPTLDVRVLFKTTLVEHLGADASAVDDYVFPGSRITGLDGLIRV